MKKIITTVLLLTTFIQSCKNNDKVELKKHATNEFAIEYPNFWELDTSGQYNTKFMIFSDTEIIDNFRENVNLTVQSLPSSITTLSQFVEDTEKQLASIPKSEILKSEIFKKNGVDYYQLIWKGYVANRDLKFKQYCFIKSNKTYIVTLTTKQSTYDNFVETGTEILNSFTLL